MARWDSLTPEWAQSREGRLRRVPREQERYALAAPQRPACHIALHPACE